MFIKTIVKTDPKTHKRYDYYRLCQSYRIGNNTRHRTIISLGKLNGLPKEEHKLLADRIETLISGNLFENDYPAHIEALAKGFYSKITEIQKTKSPGQNKRQREVEYHKVDINSLQHEDVREVGAEWLCKQSVEQLGLEQFLIGQGWDERHTHIALSHLIARAIFPASEHKTAQWMCDNSSVLELFNLESNKLNRQHLYKASKDFYSIKSEIENFLSKKTNGLFDIEDKIILYDLTNTYFEGRKAGSKLAKFGKSKEKRSDAKLVALALVTNAEGFVKYSRICRGNIADTKTLEQTIEELSSLTSTTGAKPIVVLDAGISSEENLLMLKSKGYDYLCVTRSKLKDYTLKSQEKGSTKLQDRRGNEIEVCEVEKPGCSDKYLYVRSAQKSIKEASMDDHFSQRFEEELENAAAAIHKKNGTKRIEKVWERIGRIKERYPSANKHYSISIKEKDGIVTEIKYSRKALKPRVSHGVYFLRSSVINLTDEMFWKIYNILTEIEATFRLLKTDLSIRPVFHQKDENSKAHIFLGILAYMLVNTIRFQLKQKGINHDWRNIVRIMNTQKVITTTINSNENKRLLFRLCNNPIQKCSEIYQALNYKNMPFYRKKIVLPE